MKTLLLAFVYPQIEEFLEDFFASVTAQSSDEYDTLIVNDGLEKELSEFSYFGSTVENTGKLNLIKLREKIYNELLESDYELLIFLDADDTMSNDRVAATIECAKKEPTHGFYYSDVYLLSDPGKKFFSLPDSTTSATQILDGNFIGFSHSALNLSTLRKKDIRFSFPESVIALDWLLFTFLLLNGARGTKCGGKCFYRVYNENTAGDTRNDVESRIDQVVNVKKAHYAALQKYSNSSLSSEYDKRCKYYEELEKKIQDQQFRFTYIDSVINNLASQTDNRWWSGY